MSCYNHRRCSSPRKCQKQKRRRKNLDPLLIRGPPRRYIEKYEESRMTRIPKPTRNGEERGPSENNGSNADDGTGDEFGPDGRESERREQRPVRRYIEEM